MNVSNTALDGVREVTPSQHKDHRGTFSETFRDDWFQANVSPLSFVQENQSLSLSPGVLRGLHFQSEPSAQGKLVRCVSGSVFDVAVDIRFGSPSFGKWVGVTLTSERGNQLWVPPGFLHGFCTLESNCLVAYKVTSYYVPDCDKGVRWDDAEIGIDWPDILDISKLSSKDLQHPTLASLPAYFTFQAH